MDAAWDAGLGVHALIWVRCFQIKLVTVIVTVFVVHSSDSTEAISGSLVVTHWFLHLLATPKPNSSLEEFNLALSLCSIMCCRIPSSHHKSYL